MLRYGIMMLFYIFSAIAQADNVYYPPVTVGVLVPMQHVAMDEITDGFQQELTKNYPGKITFLVENAKGDVHLLHSILQQFKQKKVDLYAPIGTQPTQIALTVITKVPMVGIASKEILSDHAVTVNDEISVVKHIQLMQRVIPRLKKITLLHTASNKIIPEVSDCIQAAKHYHIRVQDLTIRQLSDLDTVSKQIDNDSQVIFILKDSLVASGIRALLNEAMKRHLPVVTSDDGTVQVGAAFALGAKEYQIGVEGAKLAARILKETAIKDISMVTMDPLFVFINPAAAKQQGVSVNRIERAARQLGYSVVKWNGL